MQTVKIRRAESMTDAHTTKCASDSEMSKKSLRQLRLPSGLAKVDELRDELDDFMDVLMGRVDPPIDNGPMTLMEFANAAYSRAVEITMLIQRGEADGFVQKNSAHYRFRTGELRNFVELATKAIDLGSRRVTASKMAYEQEYG